MNPWLIILLLALLLTGCVMIFYVILTQIILFIARRHVNKTLTQYTNRLEGMLPGKNCGKCGCETCHAYAEALAFGREQDFALCQEGGEELADKLHACIEELEKLSAPEEAPALDAHEDVNC